MAMILDFIETFLLLLNGLFSDKLVKGFAKIVRWVWVYTLLAIIVGSVLVNIAGVVSGNLTLSETLTVFVWASGMALAITVIAFAAVVIVAMVQKLVSLLRRGIGSANVHSD